MTFQPLANAKLAARPFEAADARPLFEQRLEAMRQDGRYHQMFAAYGATP
ncbi:hypothetical protein [Aeromonas australiensis]|nr:hypothetical protein [Aeromonas australiensis]